LSSIPISSIYDRLQDGLPYVMLVWSIRANDAKIDIYHLGAFGSSAKPEMNSIMKHRDDSGGTIGQLIGLTAIWRI
jgi:hypothetical protein